VLDDIDVEKLQPIFDKIYKFFIKKGMLKEYEFFDNTLLVSLDGTYYYSSKKIHCSHCQTRKTVDSNGKETIQYFHSAVTPIISHPNKSKVYSLFPEVITNKDGNGKQDCEINATKRWLKKDHLIAKNHKLCILGDDLYAKTSLIKEIRLKKYNYIFVCKKSSHKKLYEIAQMIDNLGSCDTKTVTKKNKSRRKETYEYKWINEVNLTGNDDSIDVNWCSVKVTDEKGKIIYDGAFITDYK